MNNNIHQEESKYDEILKKKKKYEVQTYYIIILDDYIKRPNSFTNVCYISWKKEEEEDFSYNI